MLHQLLNRRRAPDRPGSALASNKSVLLGLLGLFPLYKAQDQVAFSQVAFAVSHQKVSHLTRSLCSQLGSPGGF